MTSIEGLSSNSFEALHGSIPETTTRYPWSAQQLRQLEEDSWKDDRLRKLYATSHVDGFPWLTVALPTCATGNECVRNDSDNNNNNQNSNKENICNASSTESWTVRRYVVPYDYTFKVFVKGRWVGRDLLSVYSEELSHHSVAYYKKCIELGRLRVVTKASLKFLQGHGNVQRRKTKRNHDNLPSKDFCAATREDANDPDSPQRSMEVTNITSRLGTGAGSHESRTEPNEMMHSPLPLQHGDLVLHTVHRHEIPITMTGVEVTPIELLSVHIQRYGLIVVEKPSGLPTHATGRYFYNAAVSMLEYVLAPRRLHTWLWEEDVLLQSLVYTGGLSTEEKQELYQYYREPNDDHPSRDCGAEAALRVDSAERQACATRDMEVDMNKCPRPCHRLDRVTSGVLLLGVSGEATRRVSTALMNKTKSVEKAVEEELVKAVLIQKEEVVSGNSGEEGSVVAATAPPSRAVERIVSMPVGVCKRYLAKVRGDWRWKTIQPLWPTSDVGGRRCVSPLVHPGSAWMERPHDEVLLAPPTAPEGIPRRHTPARFPLSYHPTYSKKTGGTGNTTSFSIPTAAHAVVHSISSSLLKDHNEWTSQHFLPLFTDGDGAGGSRVETEGVFRPHVMASGMPVKGEQCTESGTITEPTERDAFLALDVQRGDPALFPSAVLLTLPVPAPSQGDAVRTERPPDNVAATLVQRLARPSTLTSPFSSFTDPCRTPEASCVVLCLPWTGRLHQIRFHLSACGHPIIGDTAYNGMPGEVKLHNTNDASGVDPTTPPPHRDGIENSGDEIVMFNPDIFLPARLRVRGRFPGFEEMQAAEALYHNIHEDDHLGMEPLCYECAGRLPVAVFQRGNSSSTDGVCLHAWSYTMDERAILAQPDTIRRNRKEEKQDLNENVSKNDTESGSQCRHVTFCTKRLPSWVFT